MVVCCLVSLVCWYIFYFFRYIRW